MKRKRFSLVVAAMGLFITSFLIAACSKVPDKLDVIVNNVSISGKNADLLSVVDGTYPLLKDKDGVKIVVKLKLKKKFDEIEFIEKNGGDISDIHFGYIYLKPLDENNSVMHSFESLRIDYSEREKMQTLLRGEAGDSVSVTFKNSSVKQNVLYDYMTKTKNFELASVELIYTKPQPQKVSNSSKKTAKESSNKWDKILDDYEKAIEEYAKIIKKVKLGDAMAAMESLSFLEKAQEFANELESSGDDMTSSQLTRFTKLQTKFTKLMSEL